MDQMAERTRMNRDDLANRLCGWYRGAYHNANVEGSIINRNLSIIKDAFNSCHDPYVWEMLNEGEELARLKRYLEVIAFTYHEDNPERHLQKYTPSQLAAHALRLEPLKP